jgi:uncharacterized Tic20 family protein
VSEKPLTAEVPAQDDKIMAAVGHATIIWPVMGLIAPLVVWATQREKSDFVAFQALQAAVYHVTLILGGLVCGVCVFCAYFGMLVTGIAMSLSMFFALPMEGPPRGEAPPEAVIPILLGGLAIFVVYLVIFGLLAIVLVLWVTFIAYGLYGAAASLQGKDFRYVVIGPRLEQYLEQR